MLIRDIATQALTTGYLTIEAENQLKALLKPCYQAEDLISFIELQISTLDGAVKQESREKTLV